MPSVEEELAARLARGEEVVLATVIKLDGEPPSQAGAKLLMTRSASLAGTLGCSEVDPAAVADAAAIAAAGPPLEALRAKGVPEQVIRRIQSPVGLDLGARTPAEIALSILAGLVAVRRGGAAGWKSTNG